MKKIPTLISSCRLLSVGFLLLTGLLSCSENSNKNSIAVGDSANVNDNTLRTMPNSSEQQKILNDSSVSTGDTGNSGVMNDEAFMVEVAGINREEIKLGKLAQQKGTVSHVKALGKMMVAEHTKSMASLTEMARTKTVSLPVHESQKAADDYKMLNAMSGKDFDKAYSEMMVEGHKEAISLFEKTQDATKDAEVGAFTAKMIPRLKKQLGDAEKCREAAE